MVVEGSPDDKKDLLRGQNAVYKAVVNMGCSPTFNGHKNEEKVIEAHLIVGGDNTKADFYGKAMRLTL